MCLFAKILDFHASVSRRPHQRSVRRDAWVSDQRDINLVIGICSSVEETNLAATSLYNQTVRSVLVIMIGLKDSPSAGVPNNTTFPPNLSSIITSTVASAAPTDATAIKLCPQACPSPVKASIQSKIFSPSAPTNHYHYTFPCRPKGRLTILSIKRNHSPLSTTIIDRHERGANAVSRRRDFPLLAFLLADEFRESVVGDDLFVADFGVVVDREAEVAERGAQGVDVRGDYRHVFAAVVVVGAGVAIAAVGGLEIDHSLDGSDWSFQSVVEGGR